MKRLFLAAVLGLAVMPAMAEEKKLPPIAGALTRNECGACHLAFPAGMLPAPSWTAIMKGLDDHFGEDASLDDDSRRWIEAYLIGYARKGSGAELRFTKARWFVDEHSGREFKRKMTGRSVKTVVNCVACHRGAERGRF